VLPYIGITLTPFVSGTIGLTMNYAAYMAEVFRAGIQAIPKGQTEAGQAVGMSRHLLMRRIILPQALRIIIPPLGNFFVSIFKDSALVSVITMRDLMFSGELLASATFKHFEIFTMVAVIYFIISYPTAKFVEWIERKVDISKRRPANEGVADAMGKAVGEVPA
jgi:ABC-type amino acid transport system permease subunit